MEPKKIILLVVNPISGDLEKESIITAVTRKAAQKDFKLELFQTTGEEQTDTEAIQSLIAAQAPKKVIAAGGDGTISLVAHCLLGTDICLGIIPAGSANGIAASLDLPATLEAQLEVALADCTLKLDVLFINDRLCLHLADLGMNAELIRNYEQSGIRGKFGYLLQSVPTIFNSESPYPYRVETENETIEETGILLAIANARKFGTGATINPGGRMNDGKFEILIFKNLDVIEIFKTMSDQPDMSPEFVRTISTDKAVIKTEDTIPFQIDGEFLGEIDSATVRIEKESLLAAVPQAFCEMHLKTPTS